MSTNLAKVRCGIVGFGFIGPHHADAIRRLGHVEVVAVSSPDIERTRAKAERFGIAKVYGRYEELLDDAEVEVVDIAAPTHLHRPVALAAIARGKHVIVDKPLALSVAESVELVDAANRAGVVNAVIFNYRYNPMVQQARVLIEQGRLGKIHLVHGHYLQDWLLSDSDFSWRLEPEKSGEAAMLADAGSHWFDLVEHVTGLRIRSVLVELTTVIKTRQKPVTSRAAFQSREAFQSSSSRATETHEVRVPDLGAALLRFSNGATGTFLTSSLCAGHKNDIRFEVHGSTASLKWLQEKPNRLWLGKRGEPDQVWIKDPTLLDPSIRHYAALPGGHNEAWPDAFRNVMAGIFNFIALGREGREAVGIAFPTFESGLRTARIAEAMMASGRAGGVWTDVVT
jgi:predicted dehydrogenase